MVASFVIGTMKPRTDSYVRAAIHACGRQVSDTEWELTWSKRRIARHLDLSYRTLQYHLDRAEVTSTEPLRVALVDTPIATRAVTEPVPTPAHHPSPVDVLDVVRRAAEQALTVTGPDAARKLTETAAALLDAWMVTGEAREVDCATSRGEPPGTRAAPGASLASQSVSSSGVSENNEPCLTDSPRSPDQSDIARRPRSTPRGSESVITPDEAREAVAPLVELCRRLHLPTIDEDGITMLQAFTVEQITAARHYVTSRVQNSSVRSPLGLLIATLQKGTVSSSSSPARDRATSRTSTTPSIVISREEQTPAAHLSDAEVADYYEAHVRSDSPGMATREPSALVKRAMVHAHLSDVNRTSVGGRS